MVRTGQLDAKNSMGGRKVCKTQRLESQETPSSAAGPQGDDNENSLIIMAFTLCCNN